MSKTMVEKNEEDLFMKWLEDADKARGTWQPAQPDAPTQDNSSVHSDTMPSSIDVLPSNATDFHSYGTAQLIGDVANSEFEK